MNNVNLLTDSLLYKSDNIGPANGADANMEKQKIEAAKGFESVLIGKLIETMQESVGQWGGEKDGAFGQVQGIFSHYLSESISEQGGIGLWKDLCSQYDQLKPEAIEQKNFDRTI